MVKKEDSVHEHNQFLLHSGKWAKRLTIILTSVLLLTMFGIGGYWLGARQQQSSPTDLLTTPKPRWVPTATPFQQSSSASTITPSQTDPTSNWKTYQEQGVPFTFQYPPRAEIFRENSNLNVEYYSHPRTADSGVSFTPGTTFQIQILKSDQNLKEFAESSLEKDESGEDRLHFSLISPVEPININGYLGYKYRFNKFGEREMLFLQPPEKKYIVKIYGYTGGFKYEAELQPIYNRILSTFKFLTGSSER